MGSFVRTFIEFFALALSLLILGRVLMSWLDTARRSQLSAFLYGVTEPSSPQFVARFRGRACSTSRR